MAKIKAKKSEEYKEVVNNKKLKDVKVRTEEGEELHRFIIIFIVLIVIILVIYLITTLVVNKRDDNSNKNENTTAETKIDYDKASVGTILNRPYDDYYVMVYDGNDIEAIHYSAIINKYQSKENHKKIYYVDLSEDNNKAYAKEPSNPKATKTSDFAFGKLTLLEIKNGKIVNYVEDLDQIKNILQ